MYAEQAMLRAATLSEKRITAICDEPEPSSNIKSVYLDKYGRAHTSSTQYGVYCFLPPGHPGVHKGLSSFDAYGTTIVCDHRWGKE